MINVLEENAQDAMEWTQFFHSGPEAPRRPKAVGYAVTRRYTP